MRPTDLATALLGLGLAASAAGALGAPLLLGPDPFLGAGPPGILLPSPTTPTPRGLYTPSLTPVPSYVTLNLPDPYGVTGPRPPKDGIPEDVGDYLRTLTGITRLELGLIVPDSRRALFDTLQADVAAMLPGVEVHLSFTTPEALNTCFKVIGDETPGTDTCVPQTPPARDPQVAVAVYLGQFDWSNYDALPYVYSLLNLDLLLMLDAGTDFDPLHIDVAPDFAPSGHVTYSVARFDPAAGSGAFVGAVVVPASVPEPSTALLAAAGLLAAAAWGRRRRAAPAGACPQLR